MPKFFNQKTIVDGIRFDSKREAARYVELLTLAASGFLYDLQLQVKYPLMVNGMKVATYIADFTYCLPDGTKIIEDVKGVRTPIYRLKRKLMLACHGIPILET